MFVVVVVVVGSPVLEGCRMSLILNSTSRIKTSHDLHNRVITRQKAKKYIQVLCRFKEQNPRRLRTIHDGKLQGRCSVSIRPRGMTGCRMGGVRFAIGGRGPERPKSQRMTRHSARTIYFGQSVCPHYCVSSDTFPASGVCRAIGTIKAWHARLPCGAVLCNARKLEKMMVVCGTDRSFSCRGLR